MARAGVRIPITVDSSGAKRGVKETEGALARLERVGGGSLASLGKKAGVAAAAYVGFRSVSGFIGDAVSETEKLAKSTASLSRITGMNTKEASAWVEVAKVRNIESTKLNMGFITLSKNIKGANDHVKASSKAFAELGVSQAALKSGDTNRVLAEVADAFEKMPNGANKAALAQKLFGRSAQALMPILNQGSAGIREQLGLAEKYGATLDKNGSEKALKAAKAQREFKMAMDGLKITVGTALMPAMADAAKGLADAIAWTRRAVNGTNEFGRKVRSVYADVKQAVDEYIVPPIRRAVSAVKQIFGGLTTWFRGWTDLISGIFHGDFGKMWDGLKDIFRGGKNALIGILRLAVSPFKEAAQKIGSAIGDALSAAWGAIERKAAGFVNTLIDIVNWPLKVLGIKTIGHVQWGQRESGGAGAGGGSSRGASGPAVAQRAEGGFVNTPTVIMGEEAPTHPEWVIATNPAYHADNVGYWLQAGRDLGMLRKGGRWSPTLAFARGGNYNRTQLSTLWRQANGPTAGNATLMAAIALAESGGNPNAHNPSGASGLWQILGLPFPGNPFDPFTNARMAGAKLRTQGLRAWEAYTNGSYRQFMPGGLASAVGNAIGAVEDVIGGLISKLHLPSVPGGIYGPLLKGVGNKVLSAVKAKIIGSGGGASGGGPGSNPSGSLGLAMAMARKMGLSITSTSGGRHAPNSYHYRGRAFDASNGVNTPQEHAFFRAVLSRWPHVTELFFDPEGAVKNGSRIPAIGGHSDHVHVAFRRGGLFGRGIRHFAKGGAWGQPKSNEAYNHAIKLGGGNAVWDNQGFWRAIKPTGGGEWHVYPSDGHVVWVRYVTVIKSNDGAFGPADSAGGGADTGAADNEAALAAQAAQYEAQLAALQELNQRLEEMNGYLKQQADDRQRLLNVSQSQYGVLAQAIAAVVSGEIGGKVGLGSLTPSFANGLARW